MRIGYGEIVGGVKGSIEMDKKNPWLPYNKQQEDKIDEEPRLYLYFIDNIHARTHVGSTCIGYMHAQRYITYVRRINQSNSFTHGVTEKLTANNNNNNNNNVDSDPLS